MKKKAYSARTVQFLDREAVAQSLRTRGGGTLGGDIGKREIVVALRYRDGTFERPWKVKNQGDAIAEFVALHRELAAVAPLPLGMESTGTYGDVFRHALTEAQLEVRRVANKATSDYAEVFDGVPSQHDGKDAAMLAELVAIGKSRPWAWRQPSETDVEIERWVDWLDLHQGQEQEWLGRVEALLSRHWPEATDCLGLRTATLLRVLAEDGGPQGLAADANAAARLRKWGGARLSETAIQALLASASGTAGVPMRSAECARLQAYAAEVQRCRREQARAKRELRRLTKSHAVIQAQAKAVGLVAACVLWVDLGDVREYTSGPAYRKAMGLNLKERSSGQQVGQLRITKRGSSRVRRWLYFAALRWCQREPVKTWYERKRTKDGSGGRALIGIVRKLALALYQVGAKGATFDERELFPGRPRRRAASTVRSV